MSRLMFRGPALRASVFLSRSSVVPRPNWKQAGSVASFHSGWCWAVAAGGLALGGYWSMMSSEENGGVFGSASSATAFCKSPPSDVHNFSLYSKCEMKLFSGNAHPTLAAEIAEELGSELASVDCGPRLWSTCPHDASAHFCARTHIRTHACLHNVHRSVQEWRNPRDNQGIRA